MAQLGNCRLQNQEHPGEELKSLTIVGQPDGSSSPVKF